MPEVMLVRRERFSLDDPWLVPQRCVPVRLRLSHDGSPPRLSTIVAVSYDESCLNIVFSAADDHISASLYGHDDPLYEEDVFEAFLAPAGESDYFELEVNPVGTTFDARIESPDGVRATMRVDRRWECPGLFAAVRRVTEAATSMTLDAVIRVPFRSLHRHPPERGESWRANFFRIDRHPLHGTEFTAWQPTGKQPADFHVTAAFGTLRFE